MRSLGWRENCKDCLGKGGRATGKEGTQDDVSDLQDMPRRLRTRKGHCFAELGDGGEPKASISEVKGCTGREGMEPERGRWD